MYLPRSPGLTPSSLRKASSADDGLCWTSNIQQPSGVIRRSGVERKSAQLSAEIVGVLSRHAWCLNDDLSCKWRNPAAVFLVIDACKSQGTSS